MPGSSVHRIFHTSIPEWAAISYSRRSSPVGSVVKNLPVMQETRVRSLGREDALEKNTTYSSILARRVPCTEEPGMHSPWDRKESDTTE